MLYPLYLKNTKIKRNPAKNILVYFYSDITKKVHYFWSHKIKNNLIQYAVKQKKKGKKHN
jgi:hypothetical protein